MIQLPIYVIGANGFFSPDKQGMLVHDPRDEWFFLCVSFLVQPRVVRVEDCNGKGDVTVCDREAFKEPVQPNHVKNI